VCLCIYRPIFAAAMHNRSSGRSSGQDIYLVLDRSGFARFVDRAVREGFKNNESRAAAHAGIPASQIHRLRRSGPARIARGTYIALQSLFPPTEWKSFVDTLLPYSARQDLASYLSWETTEAMHLSGWRPGGLKYGEFGEEEEREARRIRRRVRRQLGTVAKAFEDDVRRLGHEPERLNLAWARIIAPLLDHLKAGGLERTVDDLSDREFANFIKAGIRAQLVMLSRPPAIQRAQARTRRWADPVGPSHEPASASAVQKLWEHAYRWEHWD
jgi:hypothetical protein